MADDLYERHIKTELELALESARVVNLIGPRQIGKTTLVRDMLGSGRFVSFDDENVLAAIEADPQGQMQILMTTANGEPIIIDEVQRSKKIALTIKRVVDANRRMGQFLLTGSSNIFVSADVLDSFVGRVQTLKMLPLSSAEIDDAGPCLLLDWAKESGEQNTLPPAGRYQRPRSSTASCAADIRKSDLSWNALANAGTGSISTPSWTETSRT